MRPIFETVADQLYKADLNGLVANKRILAPNAPEFFLQTPRLEDDPQLVSYFAHNLPLLWQLGRSKK